MNNKHEDKTPNEIPTHKNPHEHSPLQDPSTPNKNNPINPKTDEPTSDQEEDN